MLTLLTFIPLVFAQSSFERCEIGYPPCTPTTFSIQVGDSSCCEQKSVYATTLGFTSLQEENSITTSQSYNLTLIDPFHPEMTEFNYVFAPGAPDISILAQPVGELYLSGTLSRRDFRLDNNSTFTVLNWQNGAIDNVIPFGNPSRITNFLSRIISGHGIDVEFDPSECVTPTDVHGQLPPPISLCGKPGTSGREAFFAAYSLSEKALIDVIVFNSALTKTTVSYEITLQNPDNGLFAFWDLKATLHFQFSTTWTLTASSVLWSENSGSQGFDPTLVIASS